MMVFAVLVEQVPAAAVEVFPAVLAAVLEVFPGVFHLLVFV